MAWTGSASTFVDLNPAGAIQSEAFGVSATQQVGYALILGSGPVRHALAWNGSANSFTDLGALLPDGWNSQATGIDPVTGVISGFALDQSNHTMAVVWQPVPEPATLVLLGAGLAALRARRRLRRNA